VKKSLFITRRKSIAIAFSLFITQVGAFLQFQTKKKAVQGDKEEFKPNTKEPLQDMPISIVVGSSYSDP